MKPRNSLYHPKVLDRRSFRPGQLIFREGEESNCAFVIESGTIDIVRETDDGRVKLATLSAGSIFGEMAMINGAPRMASAYAGDSASLVVVKEEDLRAKIEKTDPFIARLLALLVGNILNITDAHVSGQSLPQWDTSRRLDFDFDSQNGN